MHVASLETLTLMGLDAPEEYPMCCAFMRHTHHVHGSLVTYASHISLIFNCYLNKTLGLTVRGSLQRPDDWCPIFSLRWWGSISISNIRLRIAISKTNQTPGRCVLTRPPSTIKYRCAMFEVSHWDRGPRTGQDTSPLVSNCNLFQWRD